jgi:AraC-like DNA-binding protein
MSIPKLQTYGDAITATVIAKTIEYEDGGHEEAHLHHRAQLVCVTSGIVRVVTPCGLRMLTPTHALLIGSRVEHELHMIGRVTMRMLYIQPEALKRDAGACRVLAVSALLRESILGMLDADVDIDTREALLVPLILRLIETGDTREHARRASLPLPTHARLRRICESLITQPERLDTLEHWADQIGASARTVARLFRQETGMSFGQWREQLRLAYAMSRLEIGRPVEQVARDLGYADARSFAQMFRRAFGATPQQFVGK